MNWLPNRWRALGAAGCALIVAAAALKIGDGNYNSSPVPVDRQGEGEARKKGSKDISGRRAGPTKPVGRAYQDELGHVPQMAVQPISPAVEVSDGSGSMPRESAVTPMPSMRVPDRPSMETLSKLPVDEARTQVTVGDRVEWKNSMEAGIEDEIIRVPFLRGQRRQSLTVPAALAEMDDSLQADPPSPRLPFELSLQAQAFLEQVAGGSDDPADEERQQRWQSAQETSDARLRASLGGHAWLELHRRVHQQSIGNASAASTATPLDK